MRLVTIRPRAAPTTAGWLLLVLAITAVTAGWVRTVHPFLAVDVPIAAPLLVVEGWLPDHAVAHAVALFHAGGYDALVVTGGPLERGARLSSHGNHARLGAAVAIAFGAPAEAVHAVPAPAVARDRTYASAVALRHWLLERGSPPPGVDLVTLGPHARRSRLLFRQALGAGIDVGVIAVVDEGYDPARWWASSAGVRAVVGEWIAYLYARLPLRRDGTGAAGVEGAGRWPPSAIEG